MLNVLHTICIPPPAAFKKEQIFLYSKRKKRFLKGKGDIFSCDYFIWLTFCDYVCTNILNILYLSYRVQKKFSSIFIYMSICMNIYCVI